MPVCVVKLCKNNTTRNKKDTGITYHQFPADPVIFDRWIAILRISRQESWWKPGKRSVICSTHFNESDLYFTKCGLKRLCKGAVPKNALYLSSIPSDIISDIGKNGTILNSFTHPKKILTYVAVHTVLMLGDLYTNCFFAIREPRSNIFGGEFVTPFLPQTATKTVLEAVKDS